MIILRVSNWETEYICIPCDFAYLHNKLTCMQATVHVLTGLTHAVLLASMQNQIPVERKYLIKYLAGPFLSEELLPCTSWTPSPSGTCTYVWHACLQGVAKFPVSLRNIENKIFKTWNFCFITHQRKIHLSTYVLKRISLKKARAGIIIVLS